MTTCCGLQVAILLDRRRTWPRNLLMHNRQAIVKDVREAQSIIFGKQGDVMPSERQLLDAGLTDLVRAINNSGAQRC